jgi:BioD-like phosphotransacetylase family protein
VQSLYVLGAEHDSGKSVVTLGIMEILSAVTRRIGFFRPVVTDPKRDDLTALIVDRYGLEPGAEAHYGCTAETARELALEGHYERLLKLVLDRFKHLEEQVDLVVCAGTDFSSVAPALTFDFNTDLARHLGCLTLPVLNGKDRTPGQTLDALRLVQESLTARGCDILAMVANQVPQAQLDALKRRARDDLPDTTLFYALPEQASLGQPTVGEIARGLQAECLVGEDIALNQVVNSYRVTPLMFEYELIHQARAQRRHIVLPESPDERVLRAAEILLLRDVADLTLLGDPERVRQQAGKLGLELGPVSIIDPRESEWRQGFADAYYELRRHNDLSRGCTVTDIVNTVAITAIQAQGSA